MLHRSAPGGRREIGRILRNGTSAGGLEQAGAAPLSGNAGCIHEHEDRCPNDRQLEVRETRACGLSTYANRPRPNWRLSGEDGRTTSLADGANGPKGNGSDYLVGQRELPHSNASSGCSPLAGL
jgi:hypothetical protein